MKDTERLANAVHSYIQEKAAINAKYDNRIAELERYRGSVGYNADVKEINAQRDAELKNSRGVYAQATTAALQSMKATLDERQTPMKAPTNEQLNAIQALKLKTAVTQSDIEAAADLCRDNETAMSIVREIGRNNQIHGVNYSTTENTYTTRDALHYWDNMRRSCNDLFRSSDEMPYYLRRLEKLENEAEIIGKLSVYPVVYADKGGGIQTATTDTGGINALSSVLNGDK